MNKNPRLLFLMLLLAASGLEACSRASYWPHFQPVSLQPVPLMPVEGAGPLTAKGLPAPAKVAAELPVLAHSVTRRHQRRNVTGAPASRPGAARPVWLARLQARSRANQTGQLAGPTQGELPRQRSRGVALVLAVLFGGLGVHLFYLGYYGRGTLYLVLTLVGVLLFSVGVIGLVAAVVGGSSSGLLGLLIAGGILASIAGVLALIDAVLIVTGTLQPKNGAYKSRFF